MRIPFLFLFIFLVALLPAQTGFIHLQDKKLVDGSNKAVSLYGVNLGGWLLWEGWIWGGKFKKESLIKSRMVELFGAAQAEKYIEQYYTDFITEKDVKAIAAMGMNAVRLPINHSLFEKDEAPGVIRPEGFAHIDSLVAWCRRAKVYAILDLHAAPGGQSPYFISDPDDQNLWKDMQNRTRTLAVWKALAERYANEEWVGGYDLLNEPIPGDEALLLQLYKELAATIRSVDKNHLLILEGKAFATKFGFFTAPIDNNQLFSFHFYTWFTANPAKKLEEYHQFAQSMNVPLWCGEWGEDKPEKLSSNLALLSSSSYNFCGSAFWTWKRVEKDVNRPALNRIMLTEESAALIKWLNGSGKKPDATTAKKAMEDFLAALALDKTQQNEAVKKVLSTQ